MIDCLLEEKWLFNITVSHFSVNCSKNSIMGLEDVFFLLYHFFC